MASPSQEHVLRVPRSDSEGNFVLVSVKANGPAPLDLTIQATEGESPYAAEITQRHASNLREKKYQKSKEEWAIRLESILLQRALSEPGDSVKEPDKIELVATVSGSQLELIVRRNLEGITQRLGQICLPQDDDVEIDTVGWAHTAVSRADTLSTEIYALNLKCKEQESIIQQLSQQLEDLASTKQEYKNAILSKFCDLLNAKKLKIRDYQRILAGAKVDEKELAKEQSARSKAGGADRQVAKSSRMGKRKAEEAGQEETDDDEAFAKQVEVEKEDSEEEKKETPEGSEDEDVTEDDDEESDILDRRTGTTAGAEKTSDTPPPSRDLPFGKKDEGGTKSGLDGAAINPGRKSNSAHEAGNEDDETTEDDEL
ncbi:uncharacterized protein KY384_000208 [Bacidia gigantensis]|uniref:uncharacterized protein n=1 Tax=Bacidia gigantensis TaxID=2732470 RepID=UPI001D049B56|nr:uncharacterized protein KY384_000208 [Bacidia gigantensis]KAG8526215.1 hypothetical protein KY384_000208 [Bacidia gigantensis]